MSEPLTDDELTAIRGREQAATPGPWFYHPRTEEIYYGDPGDDRNNYMICNPEDFEFAAHARTDIPALLAEIDRLRAEVSRLTNAACAIDW